MSVQSANYAIRVCDLRDATCRAVLVALAWRAKPETPHLVYMRHADLMDDSGLRSKNGLKDALRRLEDAGEIRVAQVGGRITGFGAMASEYELLRIPAWIAAGEPDRHAWKVSVCEKVSVCDEKVSVCDEKVSVYAQKQPLTDPHRQDSFKDSYKDRAAATSSPSLPHSAEKVSKPKKASKPKFDATALTLPHGSGFAAAWAEFARHRQEIGHALTPTSAERTLKQLAAFNERDAVELIHRSVANGWRGVVFANDKKGSANVVELPPKPKGPSPLERSLAAMRAEYGKEDAA